TVEKIAPGPVLQVLTSFIDQGRVADLQPAAVRLNVTGVDEGDWVLRVGPGGVQYALTTADDRPDVTLTMDVSTWTDIIAGRVTAPAAVMDGRIDLEGDVMKALSLEALL